MPSTAELIGRAGRMSREFGCDAHGQLGGWGCRWWTDWDYPFPTLPLCFPPANSRFSITVGPLAVSHPPADVDTDPWHPHSALLLHCMLYPTPIFGIVGTLAPSTSQPRLVLLARSCAGPPLDRDFGSVELALPPPALRCAPRGAASLPCLPSPSLLPPSESG
ncbi:hypothetical protein B0H13DRAFT_2358458 [Mycena leptocephala]|nr:hypothetical protein B0H13DRAFT_2358458 [Mycena leptocephala]